MNASRIVCGDAIDEMRKFNGESIDLVVTSPVYANQRKKQYGGINEQDYPAYTVNWMAEVHRLLKPHGSVAIVISPHVKNGVLSDYVLKTRLALREWGWYECAEFPWIKTTSAPLGHKGRPRRSSESILWFGKSRQPYCDPKANGRRSDRLGFEGNKGVGTYIKGRSDCRSGISRCPDYVMAATAEVDRTNAHPAQFPEAVPAWLIRMLCPPGGMVLDVFAGSGTSLVAAKKLKRKWIGIDRDAEYCRIAERRVRAA